jgi:hypothetical protein
MKPARTFTKFRLLLLLSVLWLLQGCGSLPDRPVPEVDSYFFNEDDLDGARSTSEIIALLGEPPIKYPNGRYEWIYPIRVGSWYRGHAIYAPVLKVFFDESDRVTRWGFYHAITGEELPIRESKEDADAWLTLCRISDRIELEAVLKAGVTTKEEVLGLSDSYIVERFLKSQSVQADTHMLQFYVDRPSPFYIEPDFYMRNFSSEDDETISWQGIVQSKCRSELLVDPP